MKPGNATMFGLMLAALSAQPLNTENSALPQKMQHQRLLMPSSDDEAFILDKDNEE